MFVVQLYHHRGSALHQILGSRMSTRKIGKFVLQSVPVYVDVFPRELGGDLCHPLDL